MQGIDELANYVPAADFLEAAAAGGSTSSSTSSKSTATDTYIGVVAGSTGAVGR